MTDALVSTGVAVLLAAAALATLAGLTLGPLVVTLGLAERRGCGTVRWGAASVLASAGGLVVAAAGLHDGLGGVVVFTGLAATWAGPPALLVLGRSRLAGARGRHE